MATTAVFSPGKSHGQRSLVGYTPNGLKSQTQVSTHTHFGLLWWFSGKESACYTGDAGSVPGSGRSPGEGNGNPLQYSCLGNPMDRGAWWPVVHGVARAEHDLATKPPPPPIMRKHQTNPNGGGEPSLVVQWLRVHTPVQRTSV